MFRLLRYVIFFFLGYRIIKMLFGEFARTSTPQNDRHIGGMSVNKQPDHNHTTSHKEAEPEYIDYEEVK